MCSSTQKCAIFIFGMLVQGAVLADTYNLTSQYWDGKYKICRYSNGSEVKYSKESDVCPKILIVAGDGASRK